MTWVFCVLLPGLAFTADRTAVLPSYRSPGYWELPASSHALQGRLIVRLKSGEASGAAELSAWLDSQRARTLDGPDIPRAAWVLPLARLQDLERKAGGLGYRVERGAPAPSCEARMAARAQADLKALTEELGTAEDYRTRLESALFLTSAYAFGLADIVESCARREEALVYLEPEPYASFWEIPRELVYEGPQTAISTGGIRVPPIAGEPPDDYLLWGELTPLHLCSGRATLLTVFMVRESTASRESALDLIAPYNDSPFALRNCGRANLAADDAGFRVPEGSLRAKKAKLSVLGKVDEDEVLIEARYAPRRREAHLWYASLKSELEDAGELLRQTPHIDALVRDEVSRLPRYFASSEDPDGRRLVFIRLRR